MHTIPSFFILAAASLLLLLPACSTTSVNSEASKHEGPGLPVGTVAPDATVTASDGRPVSLASLYSDGPVVLVFYRGGWCPICVRALADWSEHFDDLENAGGRFVALTPEKPDLMVQTKARSEADYEVYSDGAFEAAHAFNVHFVVDDETRARYGDYGLDVGAANVSGTWELPAPATFVIDTDGVIRWVHADWDYTKRADPEEVIAAVRELTGR